MSQRHDDIRSILRSNLPTRLRFDFMVVEPDGSRRIAVELNEEQKEFKAGLAAAREQAVPTEMEKGSVRRVD
jgi:hypothetical protein